MLYHYRDSGLDNIFLENGFTVHQTAYGEGVSIQDSDGLHKAIGRWLIDTPKPLNGAELRFLRIEMELTQRDLAAVLGTTEQTLRLWEKRRLKAVNGSADRLLRVIYSESMGGGASARRIVDNLATRDESPEAQVRIRETSHGWEIERSLAA